MAKALTMWHFALSSMLAGFYRSFGGFRCVPEFLPDGRGNLLITFAMVAPVMGTAAGVAIDYTDLARLRGGLQAVADSAALAGARQMLNYTGKTATEQEQAARQTAESYVAGMKPNATKDIQVSSNDRLVTVALSQSKPLYFGGFLGRDQSTVATTAQATYSPTDVACLLAVGKTETVGIGISGSATISAPKCSMWSNSNSASSLQSSGSATATARKISAVGGVDGAGGFSPAPKTYQAVATDPYAGLWTAPARTACNYSEFSVPATGGLPMQPGVYCNGLTIQGNVTLLPGIYYVNNGSFVVKGNPTIIATGVTIVLLGASYLDWSGSATITLSAPLSGAYSGLIFVSDPSGPAQVSLIQGNVSTSVTLEGTFNGSIYLPNQQLSLGGNSKIWLANTGTKIVAKSIAIGGSATVTLGSDDDTETVYITKNLRLIK
jgi:Flp pilus assembly protein TadG